MCNSCHSYRASGRCSSNFMRAISNLFAVRSESTDDCTCDCGQNCSQNCCCSYTPVCDPCACDPCACTCDPCTCTPCSCCESCQPCTCSSGCTCNSGRGCSSGGSGGTDSYYARQYAIGRTYVSGCNACSMGF